MPRVIPKEVPVSLHLLSDISTGCLGKRASVRYPHRIRDAGGIASLYALRGQLDSTAIKDGAVKSCGVFMVRYLQVCDGST